MTDEVIQVQRTLGRELDAAAARAGEDESWDEVVRTLESARAIMRGNGPGGDLRRYSRAHPPAILQWLLGGAVDVVLLRKDQSQRLRTDYHNFRDRAGWTMAVMAGGLQLGLLRAETRAAAGEAHSLAPMFIVGVQLFMCWMVYFYTASALRESVLFMNGSRIRRWWIQHHYWAIVAGALLISLPVDSPTFSRAVSVFLWWACLQAAIILVQNRYQMRRMYTRIALGNQSAMDVVGGESSGGEDLLGILYPLLFALQGVQGWAGIIMIKQTFWSVLTLEGLLDWEREGSDLWGSRGFFIVGCLMLFMDVNNFLHTVATIREKRARRAILRARTKRSKAT